MWDRIRRSASNTSGITLFLSVTVASTIAFLILFQLTLTKYRYENSGADQEYEVEVQLLRDNHVVDTIVLSSIPNPNWSHEFFSENESLELIYMPRAGHDYQADKQTLIKAEVSSKNVYIVDEQEPVIVRSHVAQVDVGIQKDTNSAHLVCDQKNGCKSLWALNVRTKE